jgi:hypothetical protein
MSDDWREICCTCGGEPQHVHCPWGGMHVHYINDDGQDVMPPPASALKAVYRGRSADNNYSVKLESE